MHKPSSVLSTPDGASEEGLRDREARARLLAARIGCAILAKGGDALDATLVDLLIDADGAATLWQAARLNSRHTHGTGCTLASAIAIGLAQRLPARRRRRACAPVRPPRHSRGPGFGAGHGPMGHQAVRLDLPLGATPNQITLPLSDFALSHAFYKALGLKPIVADTPRYARFETPGGVTLSIEAAAEIAGPMLYLECDDLDAAVARLRAAGHAVTGPVDQSWGWREARLKDPAGNALCLYRAGENRRFPSWRVDA